MSTLDFTDKWDDFCFTKHRVALIPARMQPPHNGHLNLLMNSRKRFADVVLWLYDMPFSSRNPFSIADRERWLRQSLYILDDSFSPRVEVVRSLFDLNEAERHRFILDCTNGKDFVIITNNEVAQSRSELLGYPYMATSSSDLLVQDARSDLADILCDNGARIRACLESDGPIPSGLLSCGISELDLRDTYARNFLTNGNKKRPVQPVT
jgi:nicotinamide mononucleotide adenylyltransferase